jgi:hypothetical protein
MTTFTVHNSNEFTEFCQLVHLGAAARIEWDTPNGLASAELTVDPLQSWVYQVGQHKVPAKQLLTQLTDAGIQWRGEPMAPGQCEYV